MERATGNRRNNSLSFSIDKKADYHDYDYHDYDYYDYYDHDRHRYQHFYNHKRPGVRGCCYQGDKKIGSGEKVRWIKKCSP